MIKTSRGTTVPPLPLLPPSAADNSPPPQLDFIILLFGFFYEGEAPSNSPKGNKEVNIINRKVLPMLVNQLLPMLPIGRSERVVKKSEKFISIFNS